MKLEQNINKLPKEEKISSVEAEAEKESEDLINDRQEKEKRSKELSVSKEQDRQDSEKKVEAAMERINLSADLSKEESKEVSREVVSEKSSEKKGVTRRNFLKTMGVIGTAVATGNLGKAAEILGGESKENVKDEWEMIKRDWEKYKEVVEASNVEENIAFLEEEYGLGASGMTTLIK